MLTSGRWRWAAAAAAVVALPLLAPTYAAEGVARTALAVPGGSDCEAIGPDTSDDEVSDVTGVNEANELLGVPDARALMKRIRPGTKPGKGVTVVVVDAFPGDSSFGHGQIVESIVVRGDQRKPPIDVGIAQGAVSVPRSFYSTRHGDESDEANPPTSAQLARELNKIADQPPKGKVIALVPVEVGPSSELKAALKRLHKAGVLVIAAGGDRPAEGSEFLKDYADGVEQGEDAVGDVWPAADPEVLSVGVSDPGNLMDTLRNSGIDIAAPGVNAVSEVFGKRCVVISLSTHWAAAQVAGVAALVWSAYPKETAKDLRLRLIGTAGGNGSDLSPLVGYGIVQPVEALQRSKAALQREAAAAEEATPAKVPPTRADVLADTRDKAVWWGIAGGGALIVLLILRPMLTRLRARSGR